MKNKTVTFSCKKITGEELMRCSFNLNKTEYNLLIFLLSGNKKYRISEISKDMGLERTTIQKAMKSLVGKGLAKRTQKNLSGGGYVFFYKPDNKDEIKNKMKEITYNWYKNVKAGIDKL